jgi:hypothetical protein
MGRKTTDAYAELGSHEVLAARMKEKGYGPRKLARYCDHRSHSYISRMARGDASAKTTTLHTARLIEEALDLKGLLFTVQQVKPLSRTKVPA